MPIKCKCRIKIFSEMQHLKKIKISPIFFPRKLSEIMSTPKQNMGSKKKSSNLVVIERAPQEISDEIQQAETGEGLELTVEMKNGKLLISGKPNW